MIPGVLVKLNRSCAKYIKLWWQTIARTRVTASIASSCSTNAASSERTVCRLVLLTLRGIAQLVVNKFGIKYTHFFRAGMNVNLFLADGWENTGGLFMK